MEQRSAQIVSVLELGKRNGGFDGGHYRYVYFHRKAGGQPQIDELPDPLVKLRLRSQHFEHHQELVNFDRELLAHGHVCLKSLGHLLFFFCPSQVEVFTQHRVFLPSVLTFGGRRQRLPVFYFFIFQTVNIKTLRAFQRVFDESVPLNVFFRQMLPSFLLSEG